jgi:hypothetical protein
MTGHDRAAKWGEQEIPFCGPTRSGSNGHARVETRAAREATEITRLMAGGMDLLEAMRAYAAGGGSVLKFGRKLL